MSEQMSDAALADEDDDDDGGDDIISLSDHTVCQVTHSITHNTTQHNPYLVFTVLILSLSVCVQGDASSTQEVVSSSFFLQCETDRQDQDQGHHRGQMMSHVRGRSSV